MKIYSYASLLLLLPLAAAKKQQQRNLDAPPGTDGVNLDECPKDNPLNNFPLEDCTFSGKCGYDPATCEGYSEMFDSVECTCENNSPRCFVRACPAPPGTDGGDANGGMPAVPCVPSCDMVMALYAPICGSDGITYDNEAKLACANQCKETTDADYIREVSKGECAPIDPAVCDPSCFAPENYEPVCGSDGVTYGNKEKLGCANKCKEPTDDDYIDLASKGECPVCDPDDCQWDKMYSPVCGSDTITYPNNRARECANKCLDKEDIAFVGQVSTGECDKYDFTIGIAKETVCDPSNCVYIATWAPVCGSDGVTYDNPAALGCANACVDVSHPDYITLAYKGACASPANDPKYCPVTLPDSAAPQASCNPSLLQTECLYDSFTCPGFEGYTDYATRCSCSASADADEGGRLMCSAALIECPAPGSVETCPKEKPTEGDNCALELTTEENQICHYNPTHCPGYSDIQFQDSCQCIGGTFSCAEVAIAKQSANGLICAQDPTVPESKCPVKPPVSNQECSLEDLGCPYEPFGCPEDDPSEAIFMNRCICKNGSFTCATIMPKQCAAAAPEENVPLWCFPGDALVDVLDQGPTRMEELKVGDSIRTTGNNYERIYSFGHKQQDRVAEFVELTTSSKHKLRLTADHLVYEEQEGFIPAYAVKTGHVLIVRDDDSEVPAEVTKISDVKAKGVYAPFTPSGTLLVDGVLASSFIDLPLSGLDSQWVAHTGEFPHRFWCTVVTNCSSESYDKHGVNYYWGALPMNFLAWLSNQNTWVQSLIQTGLFMALSLLYVMKQVWSTLTLTTIAVLGSSVVLARRRLASIKKV